MLAVVCWFLVWGGMYTGLYNVREMTSNDPMSLFQGVRAFFPLLALYICIVWIFLTRIKWPTISNPVGLFFYYGLIGLLVSFLSPFMGTSLFWAGLFMAPILLTWVIISNEDSLRILRKLMFINYIVAGFIAFSLIPQALGRGLGGGQSAYYDLPMGLGFVTKNGVGRFVLILVLISFIRIMFLQTLRRYLWIIPFIPAIYILLQTQSRTSLLGFVVAAVFVILIMDLRWEFVMIGPAVAYLVYLAGYKWRAQANVTQLFGLTGREMTWIEAIARIKESPFFGWGFHADRLLLNFQHIHNSYIHAMIHSGIIGTVVFIAALISIWRVIIRKEFFLKVREASGDEKIYLIDSLLLIGVLTSRSFFESTAAFYGVDLLFLILAVAYVFKWAEINVFNKKETDKDVSVS
ncbi:MAG: O-antigen ligase family protein [Acidobacteria bacterium]|nr:O-antigen ligase family protein [Acidobacteriota bacterium]MBU1474580.1 O-antigen ligase family protein [Acidobacteriota bacterium]